MGVQCCKQQIKDEEDIDCVVHHHDPNVRPKKGALVKKSSHKMRNVSNYKYSFPQKSSRINKQVMKMWNYNKIKSKKTPNHIEDQINYGSSVQDNMIEDQSRKSKEGESIKKESLSKERDSMKKESFIASPVKEIRISSQTNIKSQVNKNRKFLDMIA